MMSPPFQETEMTVAIDRDVRRRPRVAQISRHESRQSALDFACLQGILEIYGYYAT
jgi:hypothetical protein